MGLRPHYVHTSMLNYQMNKLRSQAISTCNLAKENEGSTFGCRGHLHGSLREITMRLSEDYGRVWRQAFQLDWMRAACHRSKSSTDTDWSTHKRIYPTLSLRIHTGYELITAVLTKGHQKWLGMTSKPWGWNFFSHPRMRTYFTLNVIHVNRLTTIKPGIAINLY